MRNVAMRVYYEKRKHEIRNNYIDFLKKEFRPELQ